MTDDRASPAKLAVSALVLAASDLALLALARDEDVPPELSLQALARGVLEHVRAQASSLSLNVRKP